MLHEIMSRGAELDASDIHITLEKAVVYRINGDLAEENDAIISRDQMDTILDELEMISNTDLKKSNKFEVDFSFTFENFRVRGNYYFSDKKPVVALRLLPYTIRTIEDLDLPVAFKDLCGYDKGLVLVAGPTGSGKSTTLAAMLEYVNANRKVHLITLEDPVEYVFKQKKALIHQRELEQDTNSFSDGLKYALRQDPDVILVGEMRDTLTMEYTMTAAETGHLVFSTIHTNSAATTPERIIGSFPPHQQNQIAMQLSNTLVAIIYQRLLKRMDKPGRKAVIEVLIATSGIKNLIRDKKFHQIESMMQTGGRFGMVAFDDALIKEYKDGIINEDQLKNFARDPASISRRMR
ncbi:MAG: twitching motility protein PilT [Kosmotogales bacterium]|nr:twitching motility protein PilT [Kosmotogales bacterium]